MNISDFDDLLCAARGQPEPQRLLFVFANAELPDAATPAQRARFEAGGGGGKNLSNKDPADKAISLSSQQRRILAGANFLPEEINAIERVLNEAGIEAVLRGIDDETQRKTVSNLFKAGVSLEKVEEEKRVELETEMKKKFTTDELFEISKKLGFAKWWSNKTADINRMFELVNNEQLEEELREK